jgi:glycosyltransferase involved in cell wall biosynthesis
MKVGIDARNDGTGVGRYTFSLIRELAKLDRENEYTLFLNARRYANYPAPGPNFRTVEADIPWFGMREQVLLPRLVARERLDLVHYPNLTVPLLGTTPFVVTVHDLNYLDRGAVFPRGGHSVRQVLLESGYRLELLKATRARRLIAVSEHTRDAVVRRLGVDPTRVAVTYEAADSAESVEPDRAVLERHGLDAPFLLYVGSAYPYKNLGRLIEAFARVGGGFCLVLAGDQENFGAALKQQAAALGLAGRIIFPGPVSEAELAALYAGALAYAFVSLSEGFGLPGLEAMAAGVPVVAASAGSLPEVYGDAAHYCDPLDVESIATGLAEVASDEQLRARLVALGTQRAGEFSWRRTTEQTLAVYREALLH